MASEEVEEDSSAQWATLTPSSRSQTVPTLPPIPQHDISDLDPFAPPPSSSSSSSKGRRRTLGENVGSTALLQLVEGTEENSAGEELSPTTQAQFELQRTTLLAEANAGKGVGLGSPPTTPGGGSGFLGGVFRSISSSSTTPGTSTPPTSTSISIPNPLEKIGSIFRSSSSSTPIPNSPPKKASPIVTVTHASPARSNPEHEDEKGAMKGRDEKGKAKEEEVEMQEEEEGEVAFNFNKFLEQMRSRTAEPIAKYLRSFLKEFSRRPPLSPIDQIRIINDFLDFIASKMRTVDPWKKLILTEPGGTKGEAEFEMSVEAMEKLVMNRVWHLTFAPALDPTVAEAATDDLERDHVLSQRIKLFAWITPRHLDLPFPLSSSSSSPSTSSPNTTAPPSPVPPSEEFDEKKSSTTASTTMTTTARKKKERNDKGFIDFAVRELRKMNDYKAPRDKLVCVLNCCKVIFGLMKHLANEKEGGGGTEEAGADTFVPLLIYVVLKSNPDHLVSNIQYIQRFRNPEKLSGEGGYYLSSLTAAISFIETLDASHLSHITQNEFEAHVAEAIKRLPREPGESIRRRGSLSPVSSPNPSAPLSSSPTLARPRSPKSTTTATEQQAQDASENATAEPVTNLSLPGGSTKAFFIRSTDSVERIVSKPLSALGRIFEQLDSSPSSPPPSDRSPPLGSTRRNRAHPSGAVEGNKHEGMYLPDGIAPTAASEAIDREHEEKRKAGVETLKGVFPNVEREVLEVVLLSRGGDVAGAVESLLDMS